MISVNLLRISPDSKYLEFSVECPVDYRFNRMDIWDYKNVESMQDCSSLLSRTSNSEVMRISTKALEMEKTIIYVQFGVEYIGTGNNIPISDVICVCSDINDVYFALHDKIVSLANNSISNKDYIDLLKIKLVRDAHVEAMKLERYSDAHKHFETLKVLIAKIKRDLDQTNYQI